MSSEGTAQAIVTDDLVQVAVVAMWEKNTGRAFDPERSMITDDLREEVRAALEAVAPLIAAKVLDDAAEMLRDVGLPGAASRVDILAAVQRNEKKD